ncbi:MAG: MEKHLA domain-containing protein, partial [Planctomycetaceae bacterium]
RTDGTADTAPDTADVAAEEAPENTPQPVVALTEPQQIWQTSEWLQQAQLMLDSWKRLTGNELLERSDDPLDEARRLYHAPFVVVSHGTQADPILNYGNLAAQQLWEMDALTLTSTPSRLTAEPMHRDERAEMMARAQRDGFVDD